MPVCVQQTDDSGWEESRHSQSESPRSQTMSPASESSPLSPDVRGLQRALESLRNKDRKINQYSSHPGLEEVLDTNQQVCARTRACVREARLKFLRMCVGKMKDRSVQCAPWHR